jgi:3-hydroxyethyl bacteriochlorophyllide a dehydrogenase
VSRVRTVAVVLEEPKRLGLRPVELAPADDRDLVIEVDWSGVSTGTERLLYTGAMPPFPGMGYPLVPGYESVGRVVEAGPLARTRIGERVFVPGSSKFIDARGLFGGAARRLVTPSARAVSLPQDLGEAGVLLSLAATAHHAIAGGRAPDLVVGYGTLGRLLVRVSEALGHTRPTIHEIDSARRDGLAVHPDEDPRRDYRAIYDASGAAGLIDPLVGRLARGGEVVLAGFYEDRLSFAFPPAFIKEARLRIAAEFGPADVEAVLVLIEAGRLSLDGLITHRAAAADAEAAYATAFGDPACLKMVLDWSGCA